MTVVVGTAGHIDHGKTSLLRALTGIDADRLPEEQRRGMTIEVGYAHLRLPDGDELDFVDVPGHDRLIGNMLVGAGEIDAALLVVAADDGPRAQTIEHLELLDSLGIDVGVAAVTKVDIADSSRVDDVVAAVRALLARTRLIGSPIVPVSALSEEGLDVLSATLVDLRDRFLATRSPDRGSSRDTAREGAEKASSRLAIDRVFGVRGRGIVVTGSLRGGRLARGDSLRLEPRGRTVRVRELQVHGAVVESHSGEGRVALNLAGELDPLPERGNVLTSDQGVVATSQVLVVVHPPPMLGGIPDPRVSWPPAPGSTLRLHLGTAAVVARMRRSRRDLADLPDGRRIVRLQLQHPIAAAPGDRFVLRRLSPAGTVAGGVVLDAEPPLGPSRRRSTPARLSALASAGDASEVAAAWLELHGIAPTAVRAGSLGGHRLAPDVVATLEEDALRLVDGADAGSSAGVSRLAELRAAVARSLRRRVTADPPIGAEIGAAVIDALVASGTLARAGDTVRRPGASPTGPDREELAAMERLTHLLAVPAPPPLTDAARMAGCATAAVRTLEAQGRIVRLGGDLAYASATFAELEATAVRLATAAPMAPATFRDATGTSRKYVVAILEELDRRGVLRRTPAGHVPGPRASR